MTVLEERIMTIRSRIMLYLKIKAYVAQEQFFNAVAIDIRCSAENRYSVCIELMFGGLFYQTEPRDSILIALKECEAETDARIRDLNRQHPKEVKAFLANQTNNIGETK